MAAEMLFSSPLSYCIVVQKLIVVFLSDTNHLSSAMAIRRGSISIRSLTRRMSSSSSGERYEVGTSREDEAATRRRHQIMRMTEESIGKERASVAEILGRHKVLIRGGSEEAEKLIDDLLQWKHSESTPQEGNDPGRNA